MRIVKFKYKHNIGWGIYENTKIKVLKSLPFDRIGFTKERISFKKVKLLAPTLCSKIILVGLNYKDHAKELSMSIPKNPILFLKPPSALVGHKANIIYPKEVRRLDYEAELALVIKKEVKNIIPTKVHNYVLGYTCLNDVTARDLQKKDTQWTRSKSFDTFCPLGPWLETELNPQNLTIASYVNGERKQYSSTSNFIFSLEHLVSFISKVMRLYPGDVISTGTPKGVGSMKPGCSVEIFIEGIGSLTNRVVKA